MFRRKLYTTLGAIRQSLVFYKKKIFLILDNLKVHPANQVKEWVKARRGLIELFFLPAYSPDWNPDEHSSIAYAA